MMQQLLLAFYWIFDCYPLKFYRPIKWMHHSVLSKINCSKISRAPLNFDGITRRERKN